MKTKANKKPKKLFFLVIQAKNGLINEVISNYDYESLVIEGMDLAKEVGGFWTILDPAGKHVDGNFNAGMLRHKETQ